ncbi:MAG: TerC family protein [Rhodospirillaceae bacterium]
MFSQTFATHDLAVVALLVLLEGVLSIDNALVLGLLAKRLPKHQQKRALTYGLAGAFVFRTIAIGTAAYLLHWRFVKLLGGGYLLYVALKHFIWDRRHPHTHSVEDVRAGSGSAGHAIECTKSDPAPERGGAGYPKFWPTVAVIELTDIAFAIDSILAAIALVGSAPAGHTGPHPKLWVVITGGMLGVILMRFAAVVFIKLLEKFPRFETSAYLLVAVIGLKLVVDWGLNTPDHPHAADFHSPDSPAFWAFWIAMAACLAIGFLPSKKRQLPD